MISSSIRRKRIRRARIEMIPLIDCMFLLLTFFIYVAAAAVSQAGIPLDLAAASTGENVEKERFPIVSIDETGLLYLDKMAVTQEQLRLELKKMALSAQPKPVIIQADKGVVHEQVVGILDLARQSGISQVVFAVEPSGQKRSSGQPGK